THLGAFEPQTLTYQWSHPDPRVDALQQEVAAIVAGREDAERRAVFAEIWAAAHRSAGREGTPLPYIDAAAPAGSPPSEPWYCCAEPVAVTRNSGPGTQNLELRTQNVELKTESGEPGGTASESHGHTFTIKPDKLLRVFNS